MNFIWQTTVRNIDSYFFRLDMNTLQLNDVQHVQATFLMFSQLAHMSNLSNYFNSDVVLRYVITN